MDALKIIGMGRKRKELRSTTDLLLRSETIVVIKVNITFVCK